ncbi:unnamed protein product, partial [marine sediment metagenome]
DAILDKLNEMDPKLDELLTWKAVHKEEHKVIHRDVNEIRETLFENPGLKAQVQTLMNCKRHISKWRDFWLGVLRTVIAAAIVAVLMWLMLIYRKGGA